MDEGAVRAGQTLTELGDGSMHVGPSKSNAGKRAVTIPGALLFAADTGASLRELMDRMGHSSTRAALVYPHSNTDRHKRITEALDAQVPKKPKHSQKKEQRQSAPKQSGTQRARRRDC